MPVLLRRPIRERGPRAASERGAPSGTWPARPAAGWGRRVRRGSRAAGTPPGCRRRRPPGRTCLGGSAASSRPWCAASSRGADAAALAGRVHGQDRQVVVRHADRMVLVQVGVEGPEPAAPRAGRGGQRRVVPGWALRAGLPRRGTTRRRRSCRWWCSAAALHRVGDQQSEVPGHDPAALVGVRDQPHRRCQGVEGRCDQVAQRVGVAGVRDDDLVERAHRAPPGLPAPRRPVGRCPGSGRRGAAQADRLVGLRVRASHHQRPDDADGRGDGEHPGQDLRGRRARRDVQEHVVVDEAQHGHRRQQYRGHGRGDQAAPQRSRRRGCGGRTRRRRPRWWPAAAGSRSPRSCRPRRTAGPPGPSP